MAELTRIPNEILAIIVLCSAVLYTQRNNQAIKRYYRMAGGVVMAITILICLLIVVGTALSALAQP